MCPNSKAIFYSEAYAFSPKLTITFFHSNNHSRNLAMIFRSVSLLWDQRYATAILLCNFRRNGKGHFSSDHQNVISSRTTSSSIMASSPRKAAANTYPQNKQPLYHVFFCLFFCYRQNYCQNQRWLSLSLNRQIVGSRRSHESAFPHEIAGDLVPASLSYTCTCSFMLHVR